MSIMPTFSVVSERMAAQIKQKTVYRHHLLSKNLTLHRRAQVGSMLRVTTSSIQPRGKDRKKRNGKEKQPFSISGLHIVLNTPALPATA